MVAPNRSGYAQYKAYTEQGNSQQLRHIYYQAYLSPVLGSDTFKEEVTGRDWKNVTPEKLRQHLYEPVPAEHILAQVSHQFETGESQLLRVKQGRRNAARRIAMYLCQRLADLRLFDIAAVFGVSSINGVSRSLSRLAQETSANPALDRQLQLLIHDLIP